MSVFRKSAEKKNSDLRVSTSIMLSVVVTDCILSIKCWSSSATVVNRVGFEYFTCNVFILYTIGVKVEREKRFGRQINYSNKF